MSRRLVLGIAALAGASIGAHLLLSGGDDEDRLPPARPAPDQRPAEPAFACAHPYVPLHPGYRATYRTTVPGMEGELRTDLELASVEAETRRVRAGYVVRLDGREVGRLDRDCDARGMGDPWSGFMPSPSGLAQGRDVWRFPMELVRGQSFAGSTELSLSMPGAEDVAIVIERRFEVCCEEDITVPAGSFVALRIDVTEHGRGMGMDEERRGSLWLARDIGLVRAELGDESNTQIQELVEIAP